MFFTQEDYRKIEKWILANGRKDTDFAGAALPLKGNETVAFVQNGKNVNVFLKDLINQIFLLGVSDFLNVTDKYGESMISLTQAIQLIPFRSRKIGQVITFLDEEGHWKLFQFQGQRLNQWNNSTLWADLIKQIEGISIIDSEDITSEKDNLNQVSLKFADKNYNTADYSGLGRIYLRKNIQKVVNPVTNKPFTTNLLTQLMLGKDNTIYIIQYDYNLNGQTITIPENCVLQFEGGSISNGELVGTNTIINSTANYITKELLTISGTWNSIEAYPEWFGAIGNGKNDDRRAIQLCLDFFSTTILDGNKTYLLNSYSDTANKICLILPKTHILKGNSSFIDYEVTQLQVSPTINPNLVLKISEYCKLSNIGIRGISSSDGFGSGEDWAAHIVIEHCFAIGCKIGFNLQTYMANICNCYSHYNDIGFFIHGSLNASNPNIVVTRGTSVTMTSCYAQQCRKYAHRILGMIYSNFMSLAADHCGINRDNIADTIYSSYFITYCQNITIQSIGMEGSYYPLEMTNNYNVKISNSQFIILNDGNYNNSGDPYIRATDTGNLVLEGIDIKASPSNVSSVVTTSRINVASNYGSSYEFKDVFLFGNQLKFNNFVGVSVVRDTFNIWYTSWKRGGSTAERPTGLDFLVGRGWTYEDVDVKKLLHWHYLSPSGWYDTDNYWGLIGRGTTEERPVFPQGHYSDGYHYYDSDLEQQLILKNSNWVNEDGTLTSKVVII